MRDEKTRAGPVTSGQQRTRLDAGRPGALVKPARRASGFTMLELLVVVSVILVLMGLLVAVLPGIVRSFRAGEATARLALLDTAISRYYGDVGVYPLSASADPYSLYNSLMGADGRGPMIKKQDGTDVRLAPYLPNLDPKEVREVKEGSVVKGHLLLDPWGVPWHYQENASRFGGKLTQAEYEQKMSVGVHNPDSFDLFTSGADLLPGMDFSKGGFLEDPALDEDGDGKPDVDDNRSNW